jgi:predicted HTH transcriptional regulator
MSEQKRLKTLSAVTRQFLVAGEGQLVDFKRSSDGISAEDLVAFANAAEGGTILAGVGEQTVAGAQVGVILGCDVSDNAVLQLLNKAISCLPPVSIDIVIENLNDKPILRVTVSPSKTRPHCTPKGVYCRRDGARNRALHPESC